MFSLTTQAVFVDLIITFCRTVASWAREVSKQHLRIQFGLKYQDFFAFLLSFLFSV